MDLNYQPADSPAPSPAKGKPVGRKGNAKGVAKKISARKPAAPGKRATRAKGRGRNKTYENPRVQAAYERQKELRDLYSEVAGAAKPALEELADQAIKQMIDDPSAHMQVAQYRLVQQQLDEYLELALYNANRNLKNRLAIEERSYELKTESTRRQFLDGYDHRTADLYDGHLNRTSILDHLRREGAYTDTPDTRYKYCEEPDDILEQQGPYVVYRGDVKVPYPGLLDESRKMANKVPPPRKLKPGAKRKPEDQPDGQPDSKKAAAGVRSSQGQDLDNGKVEIGDDVPAPPPRHIGGLLSAEHEEANAAEQENDIALAEGTPASEQKSAEDAEQDLPDLPNNASDPDSRGVRTVSRRGPKANNRLIIPPLFEFDDVEIGFRDSTNDSTRKATRASRGIYLNKPNSRFWHLDQTILTYNCLGYKDGDLDPELVRKHNLHERYGFFMLDSVNEAETPDHPVDGTSPVVVLTPSGKSLQASRTVKDMMMDRALKSDAKKACFATMLKTYCSEDGIDPRDIVTEQMWQREREALDRISQLPVDEEVHSEEPEHHALSAAEELMAREGIEQILQANAYMETDRRSLPASGSRPSRPYDAVRDVFAAKEPTPPPATLAAIPAPSAIAAEAMNTTALLMLADASEAASSETALKAERGPTPYAQAEQIAPAAYAAEQSTAAPLSTLEHGTGPPYAQHEHGMVMPYAQPEQEIGAHYAQPDQGSVHYSQDSSMIDPRLLGPNQASSSSSNAFLQTALNPPSYPHIAPAPPQGAEHSSPRNPFTGQGNAKGSPVLPPLRPSRRDKAAPIEAPQPPPSQAPSRQQEENSRLMKTHSGNFYPPASARPFHHPYSLHDPSHMVSLHLQQHPPQHQIPPPMPGYPAMSPPFEASAQLASMPLHMQMAPGLAGPSQPPPAGPASNQPMLAPSPPSHNPRGGQRNSMPGTPGSAGSGKYRRIAAAPIPHNRAWPANGGAELRLAHYDFKEAIKDYRANEPPPRSGPTTIRGWNVNNVSRKGSRMPTRKDNSEEQESPK